MDVGLAPRKHQHVQSRCNQPQRLKSALAIVFPRVLDNQRAVPFKSCHLIERDSPRGDIARILRSVRK